MANKVIHLSEAEAARDFAGLLARVRSGAEVIIENGKTPVAVVQPDPPHRTISDCLALLPEDSTAVMDADFAKDVGAAIDSHREIRVHYRCRVFGQERDAIGNGP